MDSADGSTDQRNFQQQFNSSLSPTPSAAPNSPPEGQRTPPLEQHGDWKNSGREESAGKKLLSEVLHGI